MGNQSLMCSKSPALKVERGFTLVEIMVSLVIGMLGMIVVMQVYANFEGQKRTTVGGDDAQNSGAITLYNLQRDIRQAGYGINAFKLIGCDVSLPSLISSGVTVPMVPVVINSPDVAAGDANTDTILVIFGNSNGAPEGSVITAQQIQNNYTVDSVSAFAVNDIVIAEPAARPTNCSLAMERVGAVSNPNVGVQSGVSGMINGTLFNLGSAPKIRAYRVAGGNLEVCDYWANDCSSSDATNWVIIGDGLVSMRAQYGSDTSSPMDGIVDIYNRAVPSVSASLNCNLMRITSVRLVLVSRNGQPEKTAVTTNSLTWRGSTVSATGDALPLNGESLSIDLSTNIGVPTGFTWNNYRYKVFQTVVPLRNMTTVVLEGKSAGC